MCVDSFSLEGFFLIYCCPYVILQQVSCTMINKALFYLYLYVNDYGKRYGVMTSTQFLEEPKPNIINTDDIWPQFIVIEFRNTEIDTLLN